MSVAQIESDLMKLPREERREFARWFYENEGKIVEYDEDDAISPEVLEELLRRRDEMMENPSMAVPVTDEWFSQLRKKLADARTAQESAR